MLMRWFLVGLASRQEDGCRPGANPVASLGCKERASIGPTAEDQFRNLLSLIELR
jgi:hypothetical protein